MRSEAMEWVPLAVRRIRHRDGTAISRLSMLLATLPAAFAVPATAGAVGSDPMCLGRPVTILGTPGDDVITGTPGADVIATLTGRDQVAARGGDDRVCVTGGTRSERGADVVSTGYGDDHVIARRRGDRCAQGRFRGGPGSDVISLSCGIVRGGTGADRLSGELVHPGPGEDTVRTAWTLSYTDAQQRVRVDLLRNVAFADGKDSILVDPHEVLGSPFRDVLRGGEASDSLDGGPRGDRLYGRGGLDEIFELSSAHGTDVAFGGPDGAYCLGIEERHNCPVWDN